ncbi:hypothetical protein [Legionella shakespearei]|uniref:Uncharacterized protein n=1 Tax=Legionella shakespearei DSM 23087 TaxID=1122169 RepID=A0A0W0ZB10_9GAMM|nr:hypothetical protein [Legionella shakespearei]KTD66233.1 hypothetical protein Lsha_0127 [Legionella shakespearei DSM 23087]
MSNASLFKNQDFCYWLQGYFEIDENAFLDQIKISLILDKLQTVSEPWGDFNRWLNEELHLLTHIKEDSELMAEHTLSIKQNLAVLFEHVIDDSYDTPYTKEHLKSVHDGLNDSDE